MSDLAGLLAVAADNTVSEVRLSPNTLAVLLYALGKVEDWRVWTDYRGEQIPEADIETIHDLVDEAAYEVMNPIVTIPIGSIQMFAGAVQPEKWLLCNGGQVSRTDYADLFDVIGTTYGVGDGTTTFNMPDFTERSPMGLGETTPIELGTQYGDSAVALSISNLPSHDHDYADPGHVHRERVGNGANAFVLGAGGGANSTVAGNTTTNTAAMNTGSGTTGITFHAQGSNAPHQNVHPVLGVQFIIYAGVI